MDLSLAVSIGAVVFAGASAVVAWLAVNQAKKANALPVLLEFLREYRDTVDPHRRYVFRDLVEENPDPTIGVSSLPDAAREHVVAVAEYLDHLGLVVDEGLADSEIVATYMKESILRMWTTLAPYIEAERERRPERDYASYFEDLAARVSEIDAPRETAPVTSIL